MPTLTRKRCVISPKTSLMATQKQIRVGLGLALTRRGYRFDTPAAARDLGIDTTLGRRRTVQVARTRMGKALRRAWVTKRLAQTQA